MNRRELWKLCAQEPDEHRPLIEGALLHRFGFIQLDPDRKLGGLTLEALEDRWVTIVRDHGPILRGPRGFPHKPLRRLAQHATYALSLGVDDWKIYRDVARAAEMGARVLVVENDMRLADFDDWEDFLDEHVPGRLDPRDWSPGRSRTWKKLRELEASLQRENTPHIAVS
jgi:hypothetical protein